MEEKTSRDVLEEIIVGCFDDIQNSETGSEEWSAAIEGFSKMYRLKIDEDKVNWDFVHKGNQLDVDKEMKEKEIELNNEIKKTDISIKDRELAIKERDSKDLFNKYFKYGFEVAQLILPLAFYGIWMDRGFRFEKDNTYTSKTFMNLFNKFKPVNK